MKKMHLFLIIALASNLTHCTIQVPTIEVIISNVQKSGQRTIMSTTSTPIPMTSSNTNTTQTSWFGPGTLPLICYGTLATIGISYAYLTYQVIKGNNYLNRTDLWSSWMDELSINELLSIPQKKLGSQLFEKIHARYRIKGLSDCLLPLTQFIKDIQEEEENLSWYAQLHGTLNRLKVAQLFPLSKAFRDLEERLERITYFKNIFDCWCQESQTAEIFEIRSPGTTTSLEVYENAQKELLASLGI